MCPFSSCAVCLSCSLSLSPLSLPLPLGVIYRDREAWETGTEWKRRRWWRSSVEKEDTGFLAQGSFTTLSSCETEYPVNTVTACSVLWTTGKEGIYWSSHACCSQDAQGAILKVFQRNEINDNAVTSNQISVSIQFRYKTWTVHM